MPEDIKKLGVDGVNKIWRGAKLRGVGMKRAKTLVSAAEHSVGSKEGPEAARMELQNLLGDMDVYTARLEELLGKIESKLGEIPYIDKLLEIKGIGMVTVSGRPERPATNNWCISSLAAYSAVARIARSIFFRVVNGHFPIHI